MAAEEHPGEPLVRVGRVAGAHGLKGELKIDVLTDFDSRFEKGASLLLKGVWRRIVASREHKGRPLLKLEGIDTIDQAEALQWEYVESKGAPEPDEDEFLVDDLLGLRVVTIEGETIGEVDEVLVTAAHEILQVGETLIPLVKEFVVGIDFDEETVTVRLIPGMRDDAEAIEARPPA